MENYFKLNVNITFKTSQVTDYVARVQETDSDTNPQTCSRAWFVWLSRPIHEHIVINHTSMPIFL